MSADQKVLYLHGFASGPTSTKANFFVERLNGMGIETAVPDLNKPTFAEMTLTSQLQIARDCLEKFGQDSKSIVIGSSMGGLLATLLAQVIPLQGIVLLAPGFGLPRRWSEMLGDDGLDQWKQAGKREVFHYATNTNEFLNYGFITDAEKYSTDGLRVSTPALVFHGTNDETVPVSESQEFHKLNPTNVQLEVLDDDHMLYASMEKMWSMTRSFLSAL
ncbi:MAG TPA: YqiA/YcfP family alpha/beta fold hydrolase [Drouetiella sp.]